MLQCWAGPTVSAAKACRDPSGFGRPMVLSRAVEKDPDQKGFVVLERRWVVERTFGWISHWGGLNRERAGRLDVATSRLACVASLMAANALNNPA